MSNTEKVVVPYSIEAEQAVIGGLILDNEKWDDISSIISEQNFYNAVHKAVFKIIREMLNKNQPVDILTIDRAVKEAKILEGTGAFAYIAELCKNTPSSANIIAYAEIVKRDSQARSLFALGNDLRGSALQINSQESLDTLLGNTEKTLTELAFNQLDDNSTVSVNRLLVDESNYLTPQMLKSKVRRNARQYGKPAVIIVDYIQLMSDPAYKDSKNRHLEISSISRELKALAKEMDCPVIALSQLNRGLHKARQPLVQVICINGNSLNEQERQYRRSIFTQII